MRDELNEVFTSSFFTGFWAVALKFFKFEFVRGVVESFIPFLYKIILFSITLIFNTIGAFTFLILAVFHSLAIIVYLIPKLIIAAIKDAIGSI